jgi:hypothetical protein
MPGRYGRSALTAQTFCRARERGNHQMLVDGPMIAFLAIASILGIPRDEAEDYLPLQAG